MSWATILSKAFLTIKLSPVAVPNDPVHERGDINETPVETTYKEVGVRMRYRR